MVQEKLTTGSELKYHYLIIQWFKTTKGYTKKYFSTSIPQDPQTSTEEKTSASNNYLIPTKKSFLMLNISGTP